MYVFINKIPYFKVKDIVINASFSIKKLKILKLKQGCFHYYI